MIQLQLADGRVIEFPDNTSMDVIRETAKQATQNKFFGVSTQELKAAPRAPGSLEDTARSGIAGLVGALGSAASAFGAESTPAQYLREKAGEIQAGMSPARLEEMQRRAELERRASKEGIGQEIATGAAGVAEAPVQAIASGIGSSLPAIGAGLIAMTASAPLAIAGAVTLFAKLAFGALQGAGEAKGNIYDTVRDKLMAEKGLSRAEAEAQATKAQEYISANAPGIMGGAAAGMLDAVTGVESIFGKAAKAKNAVRPIGKPPSRTGTFFRGGVEEAIPEAIQGGIGQLAENVALQNAGFDTSTFEGVAGAASRDALVGALTGSAVSPLQMAQLRKEHEEEKQRKINEEKEKIDAQIAQERQKVEQEAAAQEEAILATPVEAVPEPEKLHPVRNPTGNIQKNELQEGVAEAIDAYRKQAGLPPVASYSVEDIVDAMPGVNPAEEQQHLDNALNARTGYQGEPISAKDVIDQADALELDTKSKGFEDFLRRTTGTSDLKSMSDAQLFAAFKAVQNVPQGQELEEGTNAVRFTPKQYNAAIKALDKELQTAALTVDQVLPIIRSATGLEEDALAASILNEASRRGDVDREGNKVAAPTTAEVLPEGYQIQEGTFKRGEKPKGFEVMMGEEALPQVFQTEEAAQKKAAEIQKVRGDRIKQINNQLSQQQKILQRSQENLTAMQAAGQQNTSAYKKAWAKHTKLEKVSNAGMDRLRQQLEKFSPEKNPVSVQPAKARISEARGFTLFKGDEALGTFKTRQEAEQSLLSGIPDAELEGITKAKGRRTLAGRAQQEIERRKAPEPVKEEKPDFEPLLRAEMERLGLGELGLEITKDMKAEGEYSKAIIKVAFDATDPVKTLRHESIHAMKELGFFTMPQWNALERMARKEWVNKYLRQRNINGEPLQANQQSRYDAYMDLYKNEDAVIEEAIADAFADFSQRKSSGFMGTMIKKIRNFFAALQNALAGAGFQTYEDIFGKVERKELKPTKTVEEAKESTAVKQDLRGSIDPTIADAIDRVTVARDGSNFVERMMSAISPTAFSKFRAQALNRYNRLGEYDKERARQMGGFALLADASAESAALLSDLGAGLTASALGVHDRTGGIPVYKNGITIVSNENNTVKGPVAIFAPLAKYQDPYVYQMYQFWAGSLRGRRLLADGREKVYTQQDMQHAADLLKQYPEFEQIQKEWIKYNNGLVQFLVDTGVLSKDKAEEFTRYSDYVPFYRQMDGENTIGPNLFQSISGVKGPKALKGGVEPLADFLETIVRNTQASIQMGIKNVASQRAAKVATDINMAERLNHVASGPDIIVTMENGKPTYYRCADVLFVEAVKSLNLPDFPFIGILAAPANVLRNLVTKDPGFMLANMVRDSMSAYVTSGAKMKPVVSTIANFGKSIAGTSPEFEKLLNAGIIGGYEFSQNTKQSGKTMEEAMRIKAGIKTGKDYITGVWQALEKGTTASDAATRIEVYKSTLAETGNEAEALYRSLEVMNFNRKGSSAVIRILTAAVPFLNARMQGLDVLYRAAFGEMANKDAKAIQRAFFVRGATIMALSAMYWALTHDDDEYKKQEQETRDNYWLVPSLGVKIPIPFEVGVIFKVIPERIMAYSFGDDTGKDLMESTKRNLMSTFAFNPIPQTALPLVEVATNYSFFTHRAIIGQGMEDVAPQFQTGPGTSSLAQFLGEQLGASPIKIDHLIKGYTGTMGMYLVDTIDMVTDFNRDSPKAAKRFEQMPVIKRFAVDPEARGTVTAYYELKNSVDEVTRTINLLERTGRYEEMGEYMKDNIVLLASKDYILDLEKQMKEFREIKQLVRSSSLSGEEKRDALLNITKAENDLTQNIQEIKKAISK